MSVVLIILGATFALLLVLVMVLLSLPVLMDFRLSRHQALRFLLSARPLGGHGPRITIIDSNRPRKPKPAQKNNEALEKSKKRRTGMRVLFGSEALRLVASLLRLIHFERLRAEAVFGLGDPADTGQIFGLLTPVIYGTGSCIRLEPVFDGPCLEGFCEATFRVRPIALALPLLRFVWQVFGPAR